MNTENYLSQKERLLKQFKETDLTDFRRSDNQFYETMMNSIAFSKFKMMDYYSPTLGIMDKLSKSEKPVPKLVYLICSTIFNGIRENISIQQLRKDIYAPLHKIDLIKLSAEFQFVNELENPRHTSIICNLIESLQSIHSKRMETLPENILRQKIKQQFRIENEGDFPLPMIKFNPLFNEFDDLLIRDGEQLALKHILGLKIIFEKVNFDHYKQVKTLAQKLADSYKEFKVTVMVVAPQFTLEALYLNNDYKFNPTIDFREIQLDVNLENAFDCHIKRLAQNFDL